ncbi:hypothetical protein [Brevundimonas sp.]|jgi:hypothetical protein|uniref:hypothetical protein n=1 Tax=Brevundimonas sp. TaxID=1871086 RepID=UPI0037850813
MAPIAGPKQLCFKYSSFTLLEGERIVGFQGGAEAMAIDIEGPSGAFRIGESEIFRGPSRPGRRVSRHDGTSVYRLRDPGLRYAIYGRTEFSDGQDQLVIWLGGEALDGSRRDAQIYDRLIVGDTSQLGCQHTFTYSWDFVFGSAAD